MVEVAPMTPELAARLHDTMRSVDRQPLSFPILMHSQYSAVILRDKVPVVAVGAIRYAAGHFNLWLMATDDLASVRFTLVKTIRKMLAQRGPDNLRAIRFVSAGNIPASDEWVKFVRRICPRPEYTEH